jgi:prephenate dehydratase
LGQCRDFLERCFPKARLEPSLSNAAAADTVAEGASGAAAIAPRRNAELRGLELLARGLQDNERNVTRFIVLAEQDSPPTGDDKTSLCFSFSNDRAGQLYEALGQFAQRNINLGKVESRPGKHQLGEYVLLIDCEGHRESPLVREAIDGLRSMCTTLRIFGSYPRWSD